MKKVSPKIVRQISPIGGEKSTLGREYGERTRGHCSVVSGRYVHFCMIIFSKQLSHFSA